MTQEAQRQQTAVNTVRATAAAMMVEASLGTAPHPHPEMATVEQRLANLQRMAQLVMDLTRTLDPNHTETPAQRTLVRTGTPFTFRVLA